jgi:hypothetical protein
MAARNDPLGFGVRRPSAALNDLGSKAAEGRRTPGRCRAEISFFKFIRVNIGSLAILSLRAP